MKRTRKWLCLVCLLLACVMAVPCYAADDAAAETTQSEQETKTELKKVKGYYRCYENGKLVKKAWRTIDGKKYYFDKNGNAVVGSYKISGTYYIFNKNGQLYTPKAKKVVTVNGVKYQVKPNGKAASGWSSDKKYYANKKGVVLTGIRVINEKFYAFSSKGKYNASKTAKLRKAAKYEKDFTALKKLIGKPKKAKYYPGCYSTEGKDGVLKYNNFTVYTFKYTKGKNKGKEIFMYAE